MKTQPIDSESWRERCAIRFCELDPLITHDEAQTVAQDAYAFERTRGMTPEAAADFVVDQMSQTEPPRFERRSKERAEHAPFVRSIIRYLTEPKNAS